MRGIGGAVHGEYRGADGGSDMHRSAITRHEEIGALQQGRELRQARLPGEVERLFFDSSQDQLNQWEIAGRACQYNVGIVLIE